jgi:predicted MPP superfamily phosphohydrolase
MRSWRRLLTIAAALFLLALGVRAFWREPASLRVTSYELMLEPGSRALDGLRIAILADLHTGSPFNGIDKLGRIVAETNAAKPDLVLLAGDYVIKGVFGGTFVTPEEIATRLRDLRAPLGVFAVLGNHDWWFDAANVQNALHAAGIATLEDEAASIAGPRHFWLVGVSDFWEGLHDVHRALSGVSDDAPVILFTHNPDVFPHVPPRVALTIAGHTHGGQVSLPLLGRPIVPSRYGQRYAIGHVVEDGRHLFVSPGLGTSIVPVRFRVPPEISIVTLRAPAA